jgi:hypothetical protein
VCTPRWRCVPCVSCVCMCPHRCPSPLSRRRLFARLSRLSRSGVVGWAKPIAYLSDPTAFASAVLTIVESAQPGGVVVVLYGHSPNATTPNDSGALVVDLQSGEVLLRCCFTPGCVGGDTATQCVLPNGMLPLRCERVCVAAARVPGPVGGGSQQFGLLPARFRYETCAADD